MTLYDTQRASEQGEASSDNTTVAVPALIDALGSTIKAHLANAEKNKTNLEDQYKKAGMHLIEAKRRIDAGDFEGKFRKFLKEHCDISESWAYALIRIANGTDTLAKCRAESNERMKASRARNKAKVVQCNVAEKSDAEASPKDSGVQAPDASANLCPDASPERKQLEAEVVEACTQLPVHALKRFLAGMQNYLAVGKCNPSAVVPQLPTESTIVSTMALP